MTTDERYMQRALYLAQLGQGYVSPNPMVGCVIVCDDVIVGEGWHLRYGEAHAEVNAIQCVADKKLLSRATLYVTLEPCNHTGKTPPCSLFIIENKIPRVVIANQDSNPVAGGGIDTLRQAGVEVVCGVLHDEAKKLNRAFFTHTQHKRPYIVLKWATSRDGFMGKPTERILLSDALSNTRVHQLRHQADAVLVGKNTALLDNPQLNVRYVKGKNPIRLVWDNTLQLPSTLHLFDGTSPTWVFTSKKFSISPYRNAETIFIPSENFLFSFLTYLYEKNIGILLVEGGAKVLQLFIEQNCWDEAHRIQTEKIIGEGIAAPSLHAPIFSTEKMEDDSWQVFFNSLSV